MLDRGELGYLVVYPCFLTHDTGLRILVKFGTCVLFIVYVFNIVLLLLKIIKRRSKKHLTTAYARCSKWRLNIICLRRFQHNLTKATLKMISLLCIVFWAFSSEDFAMVGVWWRRTLEESPWAWGAYSYSCTPPTKRWASITISLWLISIEFMLAQIFVQDMFRIWRQSTKILYYLKNKVGLSILSVMENNRNLKAMETIRYSRQHWFITKHHKIEVTL